jgi:membrane-anchored glycerophosphoryl diester phosphodiesterase (GDPDase)
MTSTMKHLFVGMQEFILIFLPSILLLSLIGLFIYLVYRMVDRWVDKSVSARREQNMLLARLIELVGKKTEGQ